MKKKRISFKKNLTKRKLFSQYFTFIGVEPTRNNEPHRLIVKQYYSSRCDERACENFKNFNPHILKEKSRLIKSDGSVIKFLNNNNIEVS